MRLRPLAVLASLALALAACGGGEVDDTADHDGASASPAGEITFVGDDALQWAETSKAAALGDDGSLDVTIECDGAVPHNVVFEGVEGDQVIAECSGNDEGSGEVSVEPGTYTYYCAIPGHRTAGMEGEISIS